MVVSDIVDSLAGRLDLARKLMARLKLGMEKEDTDGRRLVVLLRRIDREIAMLVVEIEKCEKRLRKANEALQVAEAKLSYIAGQRSRLQSQKGVDWHIGSLCVQSAEEYFREKYGGPS